MGCGIFQAEKGGKRSLPAGGLMPPPDHNVIYPAAIRFIHALEKHTEFSFEPPVP